MIDGEDDKYKHKSYEQLLLMVCDYDIKRYEKAYKECMSIVSKIPIGWRNGN